jgi:hypothetical protein
MENYKRKRAASGSATTAEISMYFEVVSKSLCRFAKLVAPTLLARERPVNCAELARTLFILQMLLRGVETSGSVGAERGT